MTSISSTQLANQISSTHWVAPNAAKSLSARSKTSDSQYPKNREQICPMASDQVPANHWALIRVTWSNINRSPSCETSVCECGYNGTYFILLSEMKVMTELACSTYREARDVSESESAGWYTGPDWNTSPPGLKYRSQVVLTQ